MLKRSRIPKPAVALKESKGAKSPLIRLQRFMAESGVASRRACEQIILDSRVRINGQPAALGSKVNPFQDSITLDGRRLRPRRKLYLALNKSRGCICTRSDPENRPTVYHCLPPEWRNLYTVGRLDWDSEGLIFLTNDGEFCLRLTHPRFGLKKVYQVSVEGRVKDEVIQQLAGGTRVAGESYQVLKVAVVERFERQTVLEVELAEGKNREIRRLCEAVGLQVNRLQRIQIGSIKLGSLPLGKWRTLTGSEIQSLITGL